MVLATIDWTAVGALGTLVLAAVALFALIATVLLWRAALAQVAEVRRDRDLGFQPFIVFETKEPGAVGFGASAIRAETPQYRERSCTHMPILGVPRDVRSR
jgi:hypothetical protein